MGTAEREDRDGIGPVGRVAAIAALAGVLVLLFLVLFSNGAEYTVKARFQTAGQLVKGNRVQSAGRPVGTVKSIDLARDGTAEITMRIDDENLKPLRRGTQAAIKLASLSGVANRYIDLQMPPGESTDEIPDGGLIPIESTTTAVDVDHFFNLFNEKTRKGLRKLIRGFGASYEDKSREANEGWKYLNPSLVASRRLFEELTYDRASLERFVIDNAKLVNDIAARRGDVVKLVDRLATTLNAIAVEKDSLERAIGVLPSFLRRANSTFVNLRATLDDLDPLIEESRPVTPKLRAVLAELRPFARDAGPTFRDLADLSRKPGEHNDLYELSESIFGFRDVTTRPGQYNGKERPGSFATAVRSLREQTPQWAFQRPYIVDVTGWFDDFSHSGIYDANGSASRVSTNVSMLAFVNGFMQPVPEELRDEVFSAASLGQRNRCPGSTERPAEDKSNPVKPSPDYNCDPTQLPPGN